jgi:hypothetical protein
LLVEKNYRPWQISESEIPAALIDIPCCVLVVFRAVPEPLGDAYRRSLSPCGSGCLLDAMVQLVHMRKGINRGGFSKGNLVS